MKLIINNIGLTGYYLEQKFDYNNFDEHGLKIETIQEGSNEEYEKIVINYDDDFDLQNKLAYILMILTDK